MWFRRDLRRADNPALLAALAAGPTNAVFVVDPMLWGPAGANRRSWLATSLRALDESLAGRLNLITGDPTSAVPAFALQVGATTVHAAEDFGPYGSRRDAAVRARLQLQGADLVMSGSPYAVTPGRVRKADGSRYAVFTPFHKAWLAQGWRRAAPDPGRDLDLMPATSKEWPAAPVLDRPVGEAAALDRWHDFLPRVQNYASERNRPDVPGASSMSVHLKWGEIHPRTMLGDLGPDGEPYARQLAWREFYADILAGAPDSARNDLRPTLSHLRIDVSASADERFAAWAQGRTGYPFVDAGMRQLNSEGVLHNRLRMIVASFLVKDLHLPWQRGAAHFMQVLFDGDLASNQHGWQWVAGTGTDAAPYFRIFNPVTQGLRFDPDGNYVRRYVPELAGLAGAAAHEPWLHGLPNGYPERIVDHARERAEALSRLAET